jgi:hypothetical protein
MCIQNTVGSVLLYHVGAKSKKLASMIYNRNPAHLVTIEPSNFLLPKAQTSIK